MGNLNSRRRRRAKLPVEGTIPVFYLKEGKSIVAFSPVLDLSTCGETLDEARRNFSEALEIFFDECVAHGTLAQALALYGWRRSRSRPPKWIPPTIVGEASLPLPVAS